MTKRMQPIFAICLLLVMSLSGLRVDNSMDSLSYSGNPSGYSDTSVLVEAAAYNVNDGYSRIEQQDFLSVNTSTRLSTSMFKRSQIVHRNQEKQEVSIAALEVSYKVVLFSIVMILFAAGGAGLSMPFRCLLYFIHNTDGKKRIA